MLTWPWVRRRDWDEQFDKRVILANRLRETEAKLAEEVLAHAHKVRPVRYSVERNGAYVSAPTLRGLLALMFGDWFTHLPARRAGRRAR